MGKSKFSIDQIIKILAESQLPDTSIAAVCRKYGVSQSTFFKWKSKYQGFSRDQAMKLKALEQENNNLKRLLAEKELEIQTLTNIIKKNF